MEGVVGNGSFTMSKTRTSVSNGGLGGKADASLRFQAIQTLCNRVAQIGNVVQGVWRKSIG